MPKILARHNNIRYAKDVLVASVVEAMFYLFKKRPAGWLVAYTDRLENGYRANLARLTGLMKFMTQSILPHLVQMKIQTKKRYPERDCQVQQYHC